MTTANAPGRYSDSTDNDDTIDLLAGDDIFDGLDGDDSISGNSGNDVITGGLGNDLLDGGADMDTASYAGAGPAFRSTFATRRPSKNTIGAGSDRFDRIENLIGSDFNDTLTSDLTAVNETAWRTWQRSLQHHADGRSAIELAGQARPDRVEAFVNINARRNV